MSVVEEMLREHYRNAEELVEFNHLAARIEADPLAVIDLRSMLEDQSNLLELARTELPKLPKVEITEAQHIHNCVDQIERVAEEIGAEGYEPYEICRVGESGTVYVDHLAKAAEVIREHVEHLRSIASGMESAVAESRVA
jgi:hypothetical protein